MVIDLRRKTTPTTFLVIKGQTVEMVDSFWFFGTTTNRNEMGGHSEREFTSLGVFSPRGQSSLIFFVFGGKYQYLCIDLDTIRSETFPGLERYIFLSVLDSRELVFCRAGS